MVGDVNKSPGSLFSSRNFASNQKSCNMSDISRSKDRRITRRRVFKGQRKLGLIFKDSSMTNMHF